MSISHTRNGSATRRALARRHLAIAAMLQRHVAMLPSATMMPSLLLIIERRRYYAFAMSALLIMLL